MLTRIAPTPSGYLHLGNAFSFLLSFEYAKRYGAEILLRIDDLDTERKRPEYVQDIFDSLNWLGIEWQQGPRDAGDFEKNWSQKSRIHIYEKTIQQLIGTGNVFGCSCSRRQIQEKIPCGCREKELSYNTTDTALRLYVPEGTIIPVNDKHLGLHEVDLAKTMGSFVIRRRDGLPAYQLTSVADDIHFGTGYIFRGADLLHSTAAQIYLAGLLGENSFLHATILHHVLIDDDEGNKLSKSAESLSLKVLREQDNNSEEIRKKIMPLVDIFLNNYI